MIFSAFLTLISASSLMATPLDTSVYVRESQLLALKYELNHSFSYQGSGPNQQGLIWTKVCDKPWNAWYLFACVPKRGVSMAQYTIPRVWAVQGFDRWQGPKIRVAPDGLNACARQGLTLAVSRTRNNMSEDITKKLLSFDGTRPYDGKDAIFWDQYKMDC